MEKRTPHCKLSRVKELVAQGKVSPTNVALRGAANLGLSFEDMRTVISTLSSKDFFKSMTTYSDHTVRQDVYRPKFDCIDIYLKLTVYDDVLIVSFKEL